MLWRSIESAQRKVEARNFDIRKQLLEYDDVANDQRKTIYALRNELLESQDVSPRITDLQRPRKAEPGLDRPLRSWLDKEPDLDDQALLGRIIEKADAAYKTKIP